MHPCGVTKHVELSPLSTGALHGRSKRVTLPDAVKIQF
jgi:hypothetical protein